MKSKTRRAYNLTKKENTQISRLLVPLRLRSSMFTNLFLFDPYFNISRIESVPCGLSTFSFSLTALVAIPLLFGFNIN